VSRKADLIFSIVMGVLLISALALGALGAYNRIH
jgi:hypothetical protein